MLYFNYLFTRMNVCNHVVYHNYIIYRNDRLCAWCTYISNIFTIITVCVHVAYLYYDDYAYMLYINYLFTIMTVCLLVNQIIHHHNDCMFTLYG